MQSVADAVIDMLDHEELLFLFQDYVATCVEESTMTSPSRPMGFDDWYQIILGQRIDEHTTVITVTLTWEQAARGYLCGSNVRDYRIRVPSSMLAASGAILDDVGLKRIGEKFARKMNRRLPRVVYSGKYLYCWTWD